MAYKNKKSEIAWHKANKEKKAAYDKGWKAANKEKISASAKAWHEANREKEAVRMKVYYEANKERRLAYKDAWRKANLDRSSAYGSRRRALKLNLIPEHLKNCLIEKQRVLDIFKLCKLISKVTGVKHHVDHMWPLSKSGPEWSGNMQIITAKENLSKRAKLCPELKRNIRQSLMEMTNDI